MSLSIAIHDISDPNNVRNGMLKALVALRNAAQSDSEIWTGCYVAACTFLDGLARPQPGQVRSTIVTYIRTHFPDLDSEVGAEVFYDSFRCKAVHEFAMQPPFAIGRGVVTDPYLRIDGAHQILNVDRFVHEVIEHLRPPNPVGMQFSPLSVHTPTVTGTP